MLANHLWDVAGDEDRADINNTLLQPFASYTTPDAWTFSLQTESTYSWEDEEWAVPLSLVASKLTKKERAALGIEATMYLEAMADSEERAVPKGRAVR